MDKRQHILLSCLTLIISLVIVVNLFSRFNASATVNEKLGSQASNLSVKKDLKSPTPTVIAKKSEDLSKNGIPTTNPGKSVVQPLTGSDNNFEESINNGFQSNPTIVASPTPTSTPIQSGPTLTPSPAQSLEPMVTPIPIQSQEKDDDKKPCKSEDNPKCNISNVLPLLNPSAGEGNLDLITDLLTP